MIITGSLNEIAQYRGPFGILGTDNIYCEKTNGGYNSSILLFESGFGQEIFNVLENYSKYLWGAIMRFDFLLEMLVHEADLLQNVFKGQIIDYCKECKSKECVPEICRIVCFPREPKPHECKEKWVLNYWK